MSSTQKAIKYFAMLLAGCLTIAIIAAIVNVGVGVLGAFVPDKSNTVNNELPMSNYQNDDNDEDNDNGNENRDDQYDENEDGDVMKFSKVQKLDISSSVYKVVLKLDNKVEGVRVEKQNIPSSYKVTYDESSQTLKTEDDNWLSGIFGKKHSYEKGKIEIFVSDEEQLKEIDVEMGVGAVKIKDLSTKSLHVQCGVGTFTCKNVTADSAEIDGGVGVVSCDNISFGGLDLSGGVGDINIDGYITGKIDISAGMGNLDLSLDGKKEDYSFTVENNLGPIYIDGKKTGDLEESDNNKNNVLDVEGGIGVIHIKFK